MSTIAPVLPVALLDRDGTVIEDKVYLADPEGICFRPRAIEGLQALRAAGFRLILITNQSGIARGFFTEEVLYTIHTRLREKLAEHDVLIDAIYYCPHGPKDGCGCRKPLPGLIFKAAIEIGFDPKRAFMIGDSDADMQAASASGGYGIQVYPRDRPPSDQARYVAQDLAEAAAHAIASWTNTNQPVSGSRYK